MADMHDKDIYKRPYMRPNEKWVCGRAGEGKSCPRGPSVRGRCGGGYECTPAQIGERWVCTRPDQYGGPCDSPALADPSFGPIVRDGQGVCCREVHCVPRRSLRARRGIVSTIFCLIILGVVLIGIGGPWRDQFFSPGPLTLHHQGASMASLENLSDGKHGQNDAAGMGESCHICHTTLDSGLQGMLAATWRGDAKTPQSQQCLECHSEDVGNEALFTHALAPAVLASYTKEAEAEAGGSRRPLSLALASFLPGSDERTEGMLACATCHHEHNGSLFDLKRLENRQCQSCHTNQFDSFANGHPEFSTLASSAGYDYPYERRTRIIYNHESHEAKHFRDPVNAARAPADCTACHETSQGMAATSLKPYEQMCAACHNGNIVAARDEWIHVYGFPSLEWDVYDILENELDVPAVPRTARKSFSSIMMLLLSGLRAQDADARAEFLTDLDMVLEFDGDISGIAFDEDPEIVARLYTGWKSINDAAMNKDDGGFRQTILDLLEDLRGAAIEPKTYDALFGSVEPGATVAGVMENVGRKDIVETSGWHVEPSGFRVDPASWAIAIRDVAPYAAVQQLIQDGDAGPYAPAVELFGSFTAFKEWFDAHFRIQGEDWVLLETGEKAKGSDWEQLIAELGGAEADNTPAETESENAATEDATTEAEEPSEGAADEAPAEAEDAGVDALTEAGDTFMAWLGSMSKVQRWLGDNFDTSTPNWTLRAPRSLYYRPIQHADPFIKEWLNLTGELYGSNRAAALVFDELSGRKSGSGVGACMKCHSIDVEERRIGKPAIRVNWESKQPEKGFTRFNHTPHLKLMGCAECHQAPWAPELAQFALAASAEEEEAMASADTDAAPVEAAPAEGAATPEPVATIGYLDSFRAEKGSLEIGVNFSNRDPASPTFVSNFDPVSKAHCARCHTPDKAGDGCLVCHNYHVDGLSRAAGMHSLSELWNVGKIIAGDEQAEKE